MYKNVMVPLDGSTLAECVLPHVESIVKGCGALTVTFVRAVEPVIPPVAGDEVGFVSAKTWEQMEADAHSEAENYLNRLVAKLKYEDARTQTAVVRGRAAEALTQYAEKNGIDLIVIATHGRSGVSRWVWGSVADRILRSANVPVLMVRPPDCPPGR